MPPPPFPTKQFQKIDDCAEPVCDDAKGFANMAKMMGGSGPPAVAKPKNCPLNKAELGQGTWGLLHTGCGGTCSRFCVVFFLTFLYFVTISGKTIHITLKS